MPSIALNGTTFYPSNINESYTKAGRELAAADGTLNLVLRGAKSSWDLTWERATAATRTSVKAIAQLTSTFTFTDEFGTSYTVAVPLEGFSSSISLIAGSGPDLYYDVTLKLRQV